MGTGIRRTKNAAKRSLLWDNKPMMGNPRLSIVFFDCRVESWYSTGMECVLDKFKSEDSFNALMIRRTKKAIDR